MNESRVDYLLSLFVDDMLSETESHELAALIEDQPEILDELQAQLEAADLVSQAENDHRSPPRFLEEFQRRLDKPVMPEPRDDQPSLPVEPAQAERASRRIPSKAWLVAAGSLLLGLSLASFFPSSPRNIALIHRLQGSVSWTGNGGRIERNLETGQLLTGGTLETLSTESWIEIEFLDGTRLTLPGPSQLTIADHGQKELYLKKGKLSTTVVNQPAGQPLVINTATARIEVLGTQLNIEAEPVLTTLSVNEGKVRVTRLVDGRVTEVPAQHDLLTTVNRRDDHKPLRRRQPTGLWKSHLPDDIEYGEWQPTAFRDVAEQGVREKPYVYRYDDGQGEKSVLLHAISLKVSECGKSPVLIQPGSMLCIRGRKENETGVHFVINTQLPDGGWAGKFDVPVTAREGDYLFEFKVPAESFFLSDDNSRNSLKTSFTDVIAQASGSL
ncbi:MAG: FecR family protein, partial [Pirellulaceae bacterium]|nr:FecR family protein [Pirellulaceae bacterium]